MTVIHIALCLLVNTIYFVSGQTQSSLAFNAFQASEVSDDFAAAHAANMLAGKLDFDCSAYDCEAKGIEVLCIPSSTSYDESSCPFARYCCSTDAQEAEEDVEVVISLDDTALINLWCMVVVFIFVNVIMFYCFCYGKKKTVAVEVGGGSLDNV